MVHVRDSGRKAPPSPESPRKHRKRSPGERSPPAKSLKLVEQLKETGKDVHLKAANTRKCYRGHIERGRDWLAEYFKDESHLKEVPWLPPDHVAHKDDPYADPAFAHAFDRVPNKFSDQALSLFLTYKGFHQNRGKNTIEGIRAAFKDLWDRADGGRYRGKWHLNPNNQHWEGNPAESSEVEDVMTSLKHKASSEGGDRKHSLPMTKELMEKMLAWALETCPLLEKALHALEGAFDDMLSTRTVPVLALTLKEREIVTRHLEQIAFDATAWILWTRCFELLKVQRKHISILDPAAMFNVARKYLRKEKLVQSDLGVHFEIHLTNRKGWQRKIDKGEADLKGNRYQIYPQPELPASDCFIWLLVWMRWLEVYHYGRELEPDDCIFPSMGANGIVQPREQLSHDTVQKWINEATAGAGIRGSFSTHCFRRGGAQYRFMLAPVGERWTLAKVRWWGGWAESEQRDTLIRYLLDELHAYETDFSDALAPTARNTDTSLMDEAALIQPATVEDVRTLMHSVDTNISELRTRMVNVHGAVHTLTNAISEKVPLATAIYSQVTNPSRLTIKLPACPSPTQPARCITGSLGAPAGTASSAISPMLETPAPSNQSIPPAPSPIGPRPSKSRHDTTRLDIGHAAMPSIAHGVGTFFHHTSDAGGSMSLPTPGLVIPDVPVRGPNGQTRPKSESWRDIVKHWTEGDPALGLNVPLRDWPPEWTRGNNRAHASKYKQRSVIATEFLDRFHADEAAFLAAYPEANQNHTALRRVIDEAREARGERQPRAWRGILS